ELPGDRPLGRARPRAAPAALARDAPRSRRARLPRPGRPLRVLAADPVPGGRRRHGRARGDRDAALGRRGRRRLVAPGGGAGAVRLIAATLAALALSGCAQGHIRAIDYTGDLQAE